MWALIQMMMAVLAGVATDSSVLAPPALEVVDTMGFSGEATCLAVVEDRLWVGTAGNGMMAYGDSKGLYNSLAGLPGNLVNGCTAHGKELWVATESGLARLNRGSGRFEQVAWGRFLRVVSNGSLAVAVRATGAVDLFSGTVQVVQVETDLAPLSAAGSEDGRWAVGGVDGRIYVAPEGSRYRVSSPVTSMAFSVEGLVVLTPDGRFIIKNGRVEGHDWPGVVVALDQDGAAVEAPGLEDLEVKDAVRYESRTFVATDDGVYVSGGECAAPADAEPGDAGATCWTPLSTAGCPCGPRLSALARFGGELWVGSFDNGVCRYDGRKWRHYEGPAYLPSDMVNHMGATRRYLYIATLKGVAVVDRKGNFQQYTHEQCIGAARGMCPWHASVTGATVDTSSGRVWLSDTGAVHRLHTRHWKHFYEKSGLTSRRITRIAAQGGKVAVGTVDQGVLISEDGKRFVRFDDQSGPADNWVMDLEYDSAGALWVATCTRGVSRFMDGGWTHYSLGEGLVDDYVLSVTEIDGRIWVGTLSGVTVLTEKGSVSLTPQRGLSGSEVHDMLEIDGRVYLATDAGLSIVRLGSDGPLRLSAR